jgi:serine/threonine protein kinase
MAEVSLARLDGVAGFAKLMVIKQVLPSVATQRSFIELFLDEGRLAAKLSHPNIAQTFELGEVDGRYFMAIEYVPGQSLAVIDARARQLSRPVPPSCAMRILTQACEGLDYAHALSDADGRALNVVHRDISPSNVMVTWHGSVRLLDFGIARAATQLHKTQPGTTRGKLGFMSPEQVRAGHVDRRSDIYGLGALLYLLVTGTKPFSQTGKDRVAVFNAVTRGEFPKPRDVRPDLPAPLEAIILKAMALDPAQRFQTAGELLEALTHFANARSLMALPRELSEYVSGLFPDSARVLGKLESAAVDDQVLSEVIEVLAAPGADPALVPDADAAPAVVPTAADAGGATDAEAKTVLKVREHEPRTVVAGGDDLRTVVSSSHADRPERTPDTEVEADAPPKKSRKARRGGSGALILVAVIAALVAFAVSLLIARGGR